MTLDNGAAAHSYIIKNLNLPLNTEKRLEALGLTVGTGVHVLNNKSRGTLIIKVRGTRLAIGRGISSNIEIEAKE